MTDPSTRPEPARPRLGRGLAALIGDSATLANDAFLAGLLEYAAAHGEHRSAWEYLG